MTDSLHNLTATIRQFADDRDWKQFHSPKNLAMALIVEAAELVEHFQWLSRKESDELDDEQRNAVALEMADILIYLVRLAERLDVDLLEAAGKKIALNAEKYPADKSRSRADKYTSYQRGS